MSQSYTVIFQNNSSNPGSACMYQVDPTIGVPNVMSLAWFAKYAFPTTKLVFSWTLGYDFVWSQTGKLAPGILLTASQCIPADLTTTNQISLDYQNGAFDFVKQTQGAQAGSLYIQETGNIPANMASAGIGMAGSATFAVQAQPNIKLIFTPHPQYWITFGNYTQGEVLGNSNITTSAQIVFPLNIYSMSAILNPDNTWTVQSTMAVNAAYLKARESNSSARWGVL